MDHDAVVAAANAAATAIETERRLTALESAARDHAKNDAHVAGTLDGILRTIAQREGMFTEMRESLADLKLSVTQIIDAVQGNFGAAGIVGQLTSLATSRDEQRARLQALEELARSTSAAVESTHEDIAKIRAQLSAGESPATERGSDTHALKYFNGAVVSWLVRIGVGVGVVAGGAVIGFKSAADAPTVESRPLVPSATAPTIR